MLSKAEHGGILFIVSGPSGSGKETIITRLLARVPALTRISTYATRPMRPGEKEGRPYHFVSESEFDRLLDSGEIFESETVYGSYRYGSPRSVLSGTGDGDNIMEMDPNGYRRLRKTRSGPTIGIFLLPPSLEALSRRIQGRNHEADVETRLEIARRQIREAGDYEYLLMNDDLERCCREAVQICEAERLRQRGRQQQQQLLEF